MAIIILAWLIVGGMLLYQGIYVLRTGRTNPFYVKPLAAQSAPRFGKFIYAFACLLTGASAIVILVAGLAVPEGGRFISWIVRNAGMLFYSFFFMTVGFLNLMRPRKMLRWTIRHHPELSEYTVAVPITRVIGAGLLGIGLATFAML